MNGEPVASSSLRWRVIVSRESQDLYEYIRQRFQRRAIVIVDRREGDRRRRQLPVPAERRSGRERRRPLTKPQQRMWAYGGFYKAEGPAVQ